MPRAAWIVGVVVICLPVAVLATGVYVPWLDRPAAPARPAEVPAGDRELAWLHTTTSGPTWERFVSGVVRTQLAVPGLTVDDTAAYADATTDVPELVLGMAGREGKLRVRWYKLTADATVDTWVQALAARDPAPLAVIGGGSSDRALDLARALAGRHPDPGTGPLLFITTATADLCRADDDDLDGRRLIDIYPGRSFRFCFTNRQMADAVIDYVWRTPDLHPAPPDDGTLPKVLSVEWKDDPFSTDLYQRFGDALKGKALLDTREVKFSVGGQTVPNFYEAQAAAAILDYCRANPSGRVVLVLPTVTTPARRLLRAIIEADPAVRSRLVAVTGDGIPVNAVYRDADFAWPVAALAVPLVLFCHNNPVGWDDPGGQPAPPGYALTPPTAADDVLHFADIGRHIVRACYPDTGLVPDAAALAARLRAERPSLFDTDGERLGGTGEYVCVLRPPAANGDPAQLHVVRQTRARTWERVRTVAITAGRPAAGAGVGE